MVITVNLLKLQQTKHFKVMEISNDFIVDFRVQRSIASVLGFAERIY